MGGGGSGQKSGGGGSGRQSWPKYMHRSHWAMLIGATQTPGEDPDKGMWSTRASDYANEPGYSSVMRDIAETHDHSPFEGQEAYDPDSRLSRMSSEWTTWATIVNALDADTDWKVLNDAADTQVDLVASSADITAVIDEVDSAQTKSLMTSVSRFSAGMSDIGMINSSAYIIGLAMLEDEHQRAVRKTNKELHLENYKQKVQMRENATKDMVRMFVGQNESKRALAATKIELERMGIVAEKEQYDRDLILAVKDAQWEVEVWQYGSNVLAGISGGMGSTQHGANSDLEGGSKLGGALSGAMAGAASGAGDGISGMITGAIGGGIGGYMS